MFGTLRPPRRSVLPVVQSYRRFYCGTCQGLGAHFGLARRTLLSHDAVFMALLADAVQSRGAASSRCRCPVVPTVFRASVAPDSVAMRYAAALQMLLADQWLADRGADGQWAARVVRSLFSDGPARQAAAQLLDLGVDLSTLVGFEARQIAVERGSGVPRPEVAAAPTAAVLAAAFEATADLPDAAAAFAEPEVRRTLASLGAAVGTAIYLLDALEDLEKDAQTRDFNPCLDGDGDPCPRRTQEAITALDVELDVADLACAELPWTRHQAVLSAVLMRFAERCRTAASDAVAGLDVASNTRVLLQVRSPSQRARNRVAAALSLVWAWGLSWTTHAAAPQSTDLGPDVGSGVGADLGPESIPDVGGIGSTGEADAVNASGGCGACDGCGKQLSL
ncbi:MAG: hypothetical protein KUG77_20970, partial [Nannocystaceae bacterium]|nr:hypothetical protein [Nannocystaceae bacterium]